jgi:hypothetical protein
MTDDTPQNETQPLIAGEPVLYRDSRALVAWMNDTEALQALLGRNLVPTDDVRPLLETLRSCRESLGSRPSYVAEEPLVDSAFPGLQAAAERSEVHASFANLGWRPAVVDLTKILTFQKLVHVDGIEERIPGTVDEAELLELCIPMQQPQPPVAAFTDSDGKGFTISSQNPNLRIAGGQLAEANVAQAPGLPQVKMQAVTLLVFMGTSYLQVARYRDRCFIRDGYHRAAGLLRRGITKVPCIFIEAKNFEEIATPPGSFTYEVLYGERPPRLVDYWDDAVARSVKQAAIRKVVRIKGEEFVVSR